jgi:hypothetical protein
MHDSDHVEKAKHIHKTKSARVMKEVVQSLKQLS